MGMLIDGAWIDDDAKYRNPEGGAFVRAESVFRSWITADGSSGFPAESGRYHLFLAPNCPWAHRTQIVRYLKGLEDMISITLSDLPRVRSWAYSEGIGRDLVPVDGVFELHQAYLAADPGYTGRVTVPTLFDKREWTVVSNESSEIVRMLNTEFDGLGAIRARPLPRRNRAPEIDAFNARIYETVNNGVYRTGFAKTQAAYEDACNALFDTLDWLDEVLGCAALSLRRAADRGRLAAVPDPGPLRLRLSRPFQVQQAADRGLSQPVELSARALSAPRHRRADRHPGHQARLLRRHAAREPDRDRAARPGHRPHDAARPRPPAQGGLSPTPGRAGTRRSFPRGRPRTPPCPAG